MVKLDYEFDEDVPPPPPPSSGGRLRLILIFTAIAALTAGTIWYFWPADEAPVTPPPTVVTPPDQGEPGEADPVTGVITPIAPKPPVTTTIPVTPVKTGEPGETPAAPGEGETPVETPVTTPDTPTTGVVETPVIPEPPPTPAVDPVPRKGIPHPSDPADDRALIPPPKSEFDPSPAIADIDAQLAAKQYAAAVKTAENLLADPVLTENSAPWRAAAKALTRANWAAFENGVEVPGRTRMLRAQAGDSFSKLADQYETTIPALKQGNRITNDILQLNRKLTITPGPWKIRVEKSARLLKLYQVNDNHPPRLFAVYDVGIGRLGKTPTANFVVSGKFKDPDWYAPDGRVIRYGDPENQLGHYFLKLAPAGTPGKPLLGYGLHGTPDGGEITRSLSNGCVRMYNAEVEKLYILIPNRTPVEIVD